MRERAAHEAGPAEWEKVHRVKIQDESMRIQLFEQEERQKLEELKKKNAILLEKRRVEMEGMNAELARLRRD